LLQAAATGVRAISSIGCSIVVREAIAYVLD
jgi:hypothetical protein